MLNFDNLKAFLQNDLWVPASFLAIIFLGKAWKEGDIGEGAIVILFYGIIMALTKGPQILSFVGSFLRLFGIEIGY